MDNFLSASSANSISKGSLYVHNAMIFIFKEIRQDAEEGETHINYTLPYPTDVGINKEHLIHAVYTKLLSLQYIVEFKDAPEFEAIQFFISWKDK